MSSPVTPSSPIERGQCVSLETSRWSGEEIRFGTDSVPFLRLGRLGSS